MLFSLPLPLPLLSAVLCSIFLLAGCEQGQNLVPSGFTRILDRQELLVCPQIDVIEQASSYTEFQADGSHSNVDINSALYSFAFIKLVGDCTLDKDGTLTLEVFALFSASPGVALEEETLEAKAPWFFVVVDDKVSDTAVVASRVFDQRAVLRKDGAGEIIRDGFSITIPNMSQSSMRSLRLYGGFVVDDQKWDFNETKPFYFR